ncbi:p-loop containing nucleoside triphosphate hydrolase protein [Favolaschia claudopus]|uniref:DNA 3'-5' helicase n=1 Tax=Favolaschia claudopus TaxID=2862362 RepID=A0AAV9Z241_9AGAR
MAFRPVLQLDPQRVQNANKLLCQLWNVPTLRAHQELAGSNMVKGINTVLDVPTGGGKTLAFWWPLLYHWSPEIDEERSRKNLLVISPLVALMEEQAKDLTKRGIPAVALVSQTAQLEENLKDFGSNEFRVAFVSPELAVGRAFHEHVLKSAPFQKNNIGLVIDELHAIEEWGTDDFRPAYSDLPILLKRMPTGVPIIMASATLPPLLLTSIVNKFGLTSNYQHVAFSNQKSNVALSVRIMQHAQGSYADLFTFLSRYLASPADFPQTIIYVNSRKEAEEIQDFFRRNRPDCIPDNAFEFYHRHIAESRKLRIQERIRDGSLRLGMDFSGIKRVILWREPRTFLSLVQKAGRCVRNMDEHGEMILFITKAAYAQHLAHLEAEGDDEDADEDGDAEDAAEAAEGQQMDREAAVEGDDDEEGAGSGAATVRRRGQKRATSSAYEARDRLFLSRFIATAHCRRKPWDMYFENEKKALLFQPPPGARCCDNCEPELFPVDIIRVVQPVRDKPGRGSKPTEELTAAVINGLRSWRQVAVERDFPQQLIVTGKVILPNKIIEKIAERPRAVTTPHLFFSKIDWKWGTYDNCRYGNEVVAAVQAVLKDHPDEEEERREAVRREKQLDQLLAVANKQRREKLRAVFQDCWDAVADVKTGNSVSRGRGADKHLEAELRCQAFMALPRKSAWPRYYEVIEEPISMATIKRLSNSSTGGYTNLAEYAAAWHKMFTNARTFNIEDSPIYNNSLLLEAVFEKTLRVAAVKHGLEADLLSDTM